MFLKRIFLYYVILKKWMGFLDGNMYLLPKGRGFDVRTSVLYAK